MPHHINLSLDPLRHCQPPWPAIGSAVFCHIRCVADKFSDYGIGFVVFDGIRELHPVKSIHSVADFAEHADGNSPLLPDRRRRRGRNCLSPGGQRWAAAAEWAELQIMRPGSAGELSQAILQVVAGLLVCCDDRGSCLQQCCQAWHLQASSYFRPLPDDSCIGCSGSFCKA